jgi:hypothetical protein
MESNANAADGVVVLVVVVLPSPSPSPCVEMAKLTRLGWGLLTTRLAAKPRYDS